MRSNRNRSRILGGKRNANVSKNNKNKCEIIYNEISGMETSEEEEPWIQLFYIYYYLRFIP